MAQRPASCLSVVGLLLAARAVPSSHGAHVDALITGRRGAVGDCGDEITPVLYPRVEDEYGWRVEVSVNMAGRSKMEALTR